jgi:hypothetical protein
VEVLLAQKNCASAAQAADDLGVLCRNVIFEQRAGSGSTDSSDIDDVFDSDGNAVKGAEVSSTENFALGETSSVESGIGSDGDEGVERWVELFDAPDNRESVRRERRSGCEFSRSVHGWNKAQ